MKTRTSSKLGQIRQQTAELHVSALGLVKKIHIGLQCEKRCLDLFSTVYDPTLMILSGNGNEDMH